MAAKSPWLASVGAIGGLDHEQMGRAADAAQADLQALLRVPSINPPGGEGPCVDYIGARLREAGIPFERFDSGERPNLVARIPGSGTGGGPLLLTGHVDVVPVELEHWDHDPFAGEIHDGYLFGRGTIDMKNMVSMCLRVMLLIAELGVTPSRDIIFAVVSDEEQGCAHGSRFLVENHPDAVRADYMIGEVGGFSMDVGGVRYYPIQVAEKGTVHLKLTARGRPGHGSVPHGDMAMTKLARAITKLSRTRLPQHMTASFDTFLDALAASQGKVNQLVLPLLRKERLSGVILDRVIPDKSVAETFAANLSNTVSPTMLEGGSALNVIPGEAVCHFDGRVLPGQTPGDLVREVKSALGRSGRDIEIEVVESSPGRENSNVDEDPLWQAICATVKRHDPDGTPLPYMIPGFTDAQYFGRLGMQCFGYSPLRFPQHDKVVFRDLFHGHNERIHVEGFRWGVGCLWDLVARFVGLA